MPTSVQVGAALKQRAFTPDSYGAAQAGGAAGGAAPSPYIDKATPGGAAPAQGASAPMTPPTPTSPMTPAPAGPAASTIGTPIPAHVLGAPQPTAPAPTPTAPLNPGQQAVADINAPNPAAKNNNGITAAPGQTGFLGGNEQNFVNAESGAVQGYGDMAGEDMTRQIGMMLGDLNGIGGLRSGGVQAGVDEASKQYGREIGDYAKETAIDATGKAQQENDLQIERAWRSKMYDAAKATSQRRGLGKLLGGIAGAAIGFVAGGPAGAVLGAQAGAKVGGG